MSKPEALTTDLQEVQVKGREHFVASVFSRLYSASYIWGPIAAIVLQLLVVILLLIVLRVEIFVDSWAGSSSSTQLVYVTFLTILATLITSFTTGSIRGLWFHRSVFLSDDTSSSTASSIKVLAGLGALTDQLKGWHVSLTFVLAGLITTSIVAGLTPRSIIYVTDSNNGLIFTDVNGFCINSLGNRSVSGSWFSWILPNGSTLAYDQNPGPDSRVCEAGMALDFFVNAVPNGRPNQVAYIMGDIEVFQSAAGIPWGPNGLDDIFGTARDINFVWASRCLPVLKKNPFRCYIGGQTSFDNYGQLSVSNGTCNVTEDLAVRPAIDSAAVKGACTSNHTLGTATILFGATNGSPNGTRYGLEYNSLNGYGNILSLALDDHILADNSTFAATCEVDLTQAVEFRILNYSRAENFGKRQAIGYALEFPVENGYGYQVQATSNPSCEMSDFAGNPLPLSDILSDAVLATAAGATWPLLAENMLSDGWFDTLSYVIDQVNLHNASQGGGTFYDSTNCLEDTLGLATAITIGLVWGGAINDSGYTAMTDKGTHAYERIRLGPSNLEGLLYLIPPLFAMGILIYLLIVSRNDGRRMATNNST